MRKIRKTAITLFTALAVVFACSCTKPDDSNNGGGNGGGNNGGGINSGSNGTYNGHAYVDLGLPSGTLWATCNVGASTPHDWGDIFAWGETLPKNTYDWDNYKYGGYFHRITKYCTLESYGYNSYTDTLTILQPEDDAATENWGSGWCTPVKEQWEELCANTIHRSVSQNNVLGLVFEGNGQSIFMPAAHTMDGNKELRYWSSSLYLGFPDEAWLFNYDFFIGCMYTTRKRIYGYSVRPVRSAK